MIYKELFKETLKNYQKCAGDKFDLSNSMQKLDEFENKLNSFYQKIKNKEIEPNKANKIIMEMARILVPLNYARNPRFTHDPAVPIPQLPTLSVCEEFDGMQNELIGFAQNQLVRGQNRFIASMEHAISILD